MHTIFQRTTTVFIVNDVEYRTRAEAERAVADAALDELITPISAYSDINISSLAEDIAKQPEKWLEVIELFVPFSKKG